MKNFFFYFFTFFLITFLFLSIDFVASNTILNYKNCIKFEEFYYELKKNCKGKYRFKKSFPIVETITDEMGLRVGRDNTPKKNNKKNIFIFGDSFTYGVGIEYEKTYAGLISKEKNNFNVYNFAVGSYSPSVHLFKLKNALKQKLFPKKIILFLDLTDVVDEANRWNYNEENNLVKLKSNYIYKNSLKKEKFIKRNFKILTNIFSYINFNLRNFKEIMNNKIGNDRKIKTSIQGNFTYQELKSLDKKFWKENTFKIGIKTIEKRLNQISSISKKNNIDFYLVIYPWAETLEYGQDIFNWSNFGKKICSNNNCKLIDTIPYFENYKNKNRNWSTDLYFLNDEHFNEKGANLLFKTVIGRIN